MGQEEGRKERPCAVILSSKARNGVRIVMVAPITHVAPKEMSRAVFLPFETKIRLGLDNQPSWIITDCLNRFRWPGPDIRPLPSGDVAFGFLPRSLTTKLMAQIRRHYSQNQIQVTGRD
jgi:hypothetical protein